MARSGQRFPLERPGPPACAQSGHGGRAATVPGGAIDAGSGPSRRRFRVGNRQTGPLLRCSRPRQRGGGRIASGATLHRPLCNLGFRGRCCQGQQPAPGRVRDSWGGRDQRPRNRPHWPARPAGESRWGGGSLIGPESLGGPELAPETASAVPGRLATAWRRTGPWQRVSNRPPGALFRPPSNRAGTAHRHGPPSTPRLNPFSTGAEFFSTPPWFSHFTR